VIPVAVTAGQFIAALACIEFCDVLVNEGALELSCKYEPSDALGEAFTLGHAALLGVLGWATPLNRPPRPQSGQCTVIQWRGSRGFGRVGAMGMS
jgi:hypothetical protein